MSLTEKLLFTKCDLQKTRWHHNGSQQPSRGYKKDIARENPDFIGVFTVLYGKISMIDFVDVNQTFSLCRRS